MSYLFQQDADTLWLKPRTGERITELTAASPTQETPASESCRKQHAFVISGAQEKAQLWAAVLILIRKWIKLKRERDPPEVKSDSEEISAAGVISPPVSTSDWQLD